MAKVSSIDTCEVKAVDPEKVAHVQASMPTSTTLERLSVVFEILSDANRLRLLTSLLEAGELCVCDLAAATDMSESAVSHALRLMRLNRVVKVRRAGRMSYYSLTDGHVRMLLDVALEHLRHEG